MEYVNIKQSNSLNATYSAFKKHFCSLQMLFLLLISLITMVGERYNASIITDIRQELLDCIYKEAAMLSRSAHTVNHFLQEVDLYLDLKAENELLKQQQGAKNTSSKELNMLKEENRTLKHLLRFVSNMEVNFYASTHLIGFCMGAPFCHTVAIPLGTKDGVRKNQAVVNEEGLLGKVISAGEKSARVMLMTDVNFRASVLTVETRERAILAGNNSAYLDLQYLTGQNIKPGEQVMTIGNEDGFLTGIKAGVVTEDLQVAPLFKRAKLYFVTVVG